MSGASHGGGRPANTGPGTARAADRGRRRNLLLGAALVSAVAVAGIVGLVARSVATPVAWSRLGTEDVHSLTFVGDDPARLLFGHHAGVSESSDGGRSWTAPSGQSDAMSLATATDGSLVVAGHDVLAASRDGGRSWADIPAALPSRDIHGFTRDPADPARMWAYLATGGLWESRDGGLAWEQVHEGNVLSPVALPAAAGTRLVGISSDGLAASDDGGRSWRPVGDPGLYPIAALGASATGSVLVAGGPGGLARSLDGGESWARLRFDGQPAAVAVAAGGRTIAVVTRSTEFFRSDDAGLTWPGP